MLACSSGTNSKDDGGLLDTAPPLEAVDQTPDEGGRDDGTCQDTVMAGNVDAASTLMQEAKAAYQAELETGTKQEAIEAAANFLNSKEGVLFVRTNDSAIFFTSPAGIRCGIYIDTILGGAPLEAPNSAPLMPAPLANPAEAVGKAGIYSTLADVAGFKNTHRKIAQLLTNAAFQVAPVFAGEQVTLDSIRQMSEFDVIYIRVHGAIDDRMFTFMTGQSPAGDLCKLADELNSKAVGLGTTIDSDQVLFTVYPKFFQSSEFKSDSLAYFSASNGLKTTTLAQTMHEKGLRAFIGWNNVVASAEEDDYTNIALFERLLQGATLGAAMTELEAEDPRFGDTWIEAGNEDTHAKLDYYPKPDAAKLRITATGCDEDSDCPQEPEAQVCTAHQCVEATCVQDCSGRQCGLDPNCRESCGDCELPDTCNEQGQCVCLPECKGRECGPDPICPESSCGSCDENYECDSDGQCQCVPQCGNRVCGPDPICGHSCGPCAHPNTCNAQGQCICVPKCLDRVCGPDPVCPASSCGTCTHPKRCNANGQCVCEPECGARQCGPDPVCGQSCGNCPSDGFCDTSNGRCVPQTVGFCINDWCLIPAGNDMIGAPNGDDKATNSEIPQHEVWFTRSYYIKQTEVTQGEWRSLIGNNPSYFRSCGDDCPVERVNYYDAVYYANALSTSEGLETCYTLSGCSGSAGVNLSGCTVTFKGLGCKGYRLPTEAEWEHALRARYPGKILCDNPLDRCAWYDDNSSNQTHPVSLKWPSEWGLRDATGNVREWVYDWFKNDYYTDCFNNGCTDPTGPTQGHYRVVRGGSYRDASTYLRYSSRQPTTPNTRESYLGFRIVRTKP
jgi:formylglycine-generating enzyme required for sulfatase activity